MNKSTLVSNAFASVALGFVLSLLFWLAWDVFVLAGFLIWSVASGLAGALLAHVMKRGLPAALVITSVVRIVIFALLSGLWF
jgi:hypothetical protein